MTVETGTNLEQASAVVEDFHIRVVETYGQPKKGWMHDRHIKVIAPQRRINLGDLAEIDGATVFYGIFPYPERLVEGSQPRTGQIRSQPTLALQYESRVTPIVYGADLLNLKPQFRNALTRHLDRVLAPRR